MDLRCVRLTRRTTTPRRRPKARKSKRVPERQYPQNHYLSAHETLTMKKIPVPEHWSAQQAVAVLDLLESLYCAIGDTYEQPLR